ncbi:MAG TPA: hypothetical protein VM095_01365 [Pyrinomonadaceae bacterium]|nr:hypothetical protein [Pyrinomonadaceae bacterium]
MTENRNTNATLFIPVLCACLGLLTAGAPAEARARQASIEMGHNYRVSSVHLRLAASAVSSLQVLNVNERCLPDIEAQSQSRTKAILLRKREAHTRLNRVLTVTNLPRAALSDESVKSLTAGLSRDEE